MTQNDVTLDALTGLPVSSEVPHNGEVRDGYGSSQFELPASAAVAENSDDDEEEDDEDFLPPPRQRLGKLSYALIAVLIAGLGFLGGIQMQKSHGSSSTSAAGFPRSGTRSAEGFAGGFGGMAGSGMGSGSGSGSGSGTGTGSGTSSGSATTETPAVIGTVASVNGSTITVTNFGGKTVKVTTSDTTKVTKALSAGALAAGQSVAVVGTTATDGTVAATSITVTG